MTKKFKATRIYVKAIKDGMLKRQPCVVCGNPKVHGHHPDYDKPLEVIWLCPKHHMQEHVKRREYNIISPRKPCSQCGKRRVISSYKMNDSVCTYCYRKRDRAILDAAHAADPIQAAVDEGDRRKILDNTMGGLVK